MKSLAALFLILGFAFAAQAQTGNVGPNGPNGGSQGSGDNGRAYSNGNIPSQYEQNQNRPDSTLRSADTTYMQQQWNDKSTAQPQNKNKRSASTNKNTATTTKKKK